MNSQCFGAANRTPIPPAASLSIKRIPALSKADWSLAKAAKIGIATIRRIESQEGPMMGYVSTYIKSYGR